MSLLLLFVIRPHILEKATVEGRTKKSSHSKDSVTRKPSRSQSLIEKGHKLPIRTKRLSKEAPPGKNNHYVVLKI